MTLTPKILIGVVLYNEENKIGYLLEKFIGFELKYPFKVLVINDGSTDNSEKIVQEFIKKYKILNIGLLSNKVNSGIGFTIRKIIHYGENNKFDICVIMAGNGKDTPVEIPNLLNPIICNDYDYVQGSRFSTGGSFKNLPFLRKCMVLSFTFLMSAFTGFKCSDATNGFRAYKLSIFKDSRINIDQKWLDRYELETYLHYKVITLGYRIKEVAVSKNYLPGIKNYSKIRPIIDWWKLARPILFLKLGLKN